ncbi:hypothetical protein [Azospirillum argentinense]|uniref:Uncharacterized protein n=1 Tax=Azospirillum argentinense TaxID=2970906 RepID=A0A5B0KNY7_9PROT|nr:hypothetical protein FH063_006643 [Azospirillum argentinense]
MFAPPHPFALLALRAAALLDAGRMIAARRSGDGRKQRGA